MTYANGDVYEGDFRYNERHGNGKYIYTNGNIYEGDWIEDKRHGKGKTTYPSGIVYRGIFRNGILVKNSSKRLKNNNKRKRNETTDNSKGKKSRNF